MLHLPFSHPQNAPMHSDSARPVDLNGSKPTPNDSTQPNSPQLASTHLNSGGELLYRGLLGASWRPLGQLWVRLGGDQNGRRSKEKRRSISRAKKVRGSKVDRALRGGRRIQSPRAFRQAAALGGLGAWHFEAWRLSIAVLTTIRQLEAIVRGCPLEHLQPHLR